MGDKTGSKIKDTFKDILQVQNANNGVDGTLRAIEDQEGTVSALSLSTGAVRLTTGTLDLASGTNIDLNSQNLDLGGGMTLDSDAANQGRFFSANGTAVRFDGTVASAVNNFKIVPSITTNSIKLVAEGSDANIDIEFVPKGTGVVLGIPGSQDLWETVSSDSGSTIANTPTDTLTVAGGTGITTAIAADTLTITYDAATADQNLFLNVATDSGTAVADTPTDTLTLTGGTGIDTAAAADVVTFSLDLNELPTSTIVVGGDFAVYVDGTVSSKATWNEVIGDLDILTAVAFTSGTSGQIELNNGFTIQWTRRLGEGSVTWPVAFTTVYNAWLTALTGSSLGESSLRLSVLSTTGATVVADSVVASGTTFMVLAIGDR